MPMKSRPYKRLRSYRRNRGPIARGVSSVRCSPRCATSARSARRTGKLRSRSPSAWNASIRHADSDGGFVTINLPFHRF